MKPKITFKANVLLAFMLFAVGNGVHSQEFGYGALIDDALSLKVPEIDVSAVQPQEFNVAEVTASSVMLKTPPIGNQYSQYSCCAWAVGYAACGILSYERYGRDWDVARRSPSFLYNQLISDHVDCKQLLSLSEVLDFVKRNGVCSYNTMPYRSNNCSAQPNSYQKYEASLNKIDYGRVSKINIVDKIKAFLLKGIPVVFSLNTAKEYTEAVQGNGVITSYSKNANGVGHACCFVGYDDTKQMLKIQNSWGTNAGDNGFLWVSYSATPNMVKYAYAVYPVENAEYEFEIEGSGVLCDKEYYSIRNCPSTASVRWSTTREFAMPNSLVEAVYLTNEGNDVMITRRIITLDSEDGISKKMEFQYTGDLTIYADVELDGKTFHLEKKIFVGTNKKPIVLWNGKEINKSPGYFLSGTINLSCNNVASSNLKWECDIPGVGNEVYTNCSSVSLKHKSGGLLKVKVINTEGCDKDNFQLFGFNMVPPAVISPVNPVEAGGNINAKVYSCIAASDGNAMSAYSSSTQSEVVEKIPYEGSFTVELWSNTYGKMASYSFDNYEVFIPAVGLDPGVYYLKLIIDEQLRHTASVVIR